MGNKKKGTEEKKMIEVLPIWKAPKHVGGTLDAGQRRNEMCQ